MAENSRILTDGVHPAEPKLPALHTDPEQQQFLTGATFNPDFAEKEGGPEGTNVWVCLFSNSCKHTYT